VYGREVLGAYSFAMATGAVLCVFVGLGTQGFVQQQLSQQPELTTSATGALYGFQLATGLAIVLATHLVALAFADDPVMVWIVTLIVAYHVLQRVTNLFVVGFTARQEMWIGAALPPARLGMALLLLAGAAALGLSAAFALASLPIAALAGLAATGLYTVHRVGRVRLNLRPAEIAGYLREGQPYFYVMLLTTVYSRAGVILITMLSGHAETGVYAAAERLVAAASTVQGMFATALLPVLTQLWSRDTARFADLTQRAGRLTMFITLPVATLLALFSKDIVHILYADAFADAATVLACIAAVLVVRGAAQQLAVASTGTDHQAILVRTKVLGLIVLAVASLALIPTHGAMGLVGATLAGETTAAAANYLLLRRAGVRVVYGRGVWRVALACVIAVGLAWLLAGQPFRLRLPLVMGGGALALWAVGAVRSQDLAYMRAIMKAGGPRPSP
jgi:O-antigen/teichoic acid export membrane protein